MIDFHLYKLKAFSPLNALTQSREREGALVRVTFPDGKKGYGDIHPWVELKDIPLKMQLQMLKEGKTTPLTEQSLNFAKIDAEGRAKGINLFEGLTIPKSHLLVSKKEDLKKASTFTHFKVKATEEKKEWIQTLPGNIRIDFNCKPTIAGFLEFMKEIPTAKIDFCEDPFSYGEEQWSQVDYPLACDWQSERAIGTKHTLVIKPAVQAIEPFLRAKQRLVITSYMDHPFGQLCAAYCAAKYADRMDVCGLLTHQLYETNPFSEQLSVEGAELIPSQGTGFGFDAALENLSWQSL